MPASNAKEPWHIKAPMAKFLEPETRFHHVKVYLFGLLTPFHGCLHSLLCKAPHLSVMSHTIHVSLFSGGNEGLLRRLGKYIWLPHVSDQLSRLPFQHGV